ncbi:hypothetical protein PR048_022846 [Dryococelus australis]|uniref:Uncharacterized protein n=1 Tax=Dryococelus australis TaxID=614101 RepID=A0ABQ9GSH7_9NEOP|nr:hypothetical protein PR048_022846 [Dryococelus australis]
MNHSKQRKQLRSFVCLVNVVQLRSSTRNLRIYGSPFAARESNAARLNGAEKVLAVLKPLLFQSSRWKRDCWREITRAPEADYRPPQGVVINALCYLVGCAAQTRNNYVYTIVYTGSEWVKATGSSEIQRCLHQFACHKHSIAGGWVPSSQDERIASSRNPKEDRSSPRKPRRPAGATVAGRLARSPPIKANRVGFNPRIFARGNRVGRCRWSTGFLGDLPFPPPLHILIFTSITLIGSQDLAVKGRPNLFPRFPPTNGIVRHDTHVRESAPGDRTRCASTRCTTACLDGDEEASAGSDRVGVRRAQASGRKTEPLKCSKEVVSGITLQPAGPRWCSGQTTCPSPRRTGFDSLRIFTSGNLNGLCCWLAFSGGFFPPVSPSLAYRRWSIPHPTSPSSALKTSMLPSVSCNLAIF